MTRLRVSLLAAAIAFALGAGVEDTAHNFSVTGPVGSRTTATQICIACHTTHVADDDQAGWKSRPGGIGYLPYQSPTLEAEVGPPDGVSRMCLSCHDGAVATATIGQRPADPFWDAALRRRSGPGGESPFLSSGSHPVSIRYNDALRRGLDGALTTIPNEPRALVGRPSVRLLDGQGKVQCTSCHDPHSDPAADGAHVPPFWKADTFSEVCESCHTANMADAGHASGRHLPEGCGSCHVGHGVARQPLLPAPEEAACFQCHGEPEGARTARAAGQLSPSAAPVRIDDLFDLPYRHPVTDDRVTHTPGEVRRDGFQSGAVERHVECADCHPPHGPGSGTHDGYRAPGVAPTRESTGLSESRLCYQCHTSQSNLGFGATDKAVEFSPGRGSSHPIEQPSSGRSSTLISPWTPGAVMTCSDCHGPDRTDARRGPHGSSHPYILRDDYVVRDGGGESEQSYAACYACHDRSEVLGGEGFSGHGEHVVMAGISCYSCHDSHGSAEYPGLIRFGKDPRVGTVEPSSSGRFEYVPGPNPACYLSCHGVDHDPLAYP